MNVAVLAGNYLTAVGSAVLCSSIWKRKNLWIAVRDSWSPVAITRRSAGSFRAAVSSLSLQENALRPSLPRTSTARKLAIGSGAIAAARTMGACCCRSGHGADPVAGEVRTMRPPPRADAGRGAQVGSERRLTVGSRPHEVEPPARAKCRDSHTCRDHNQ